MLIGAAVAAVIVILVGVLVLGGGGGGGEKATGLGTTKGNIETGKPFIHHVVASSDTVLLVKAIPQGQFKLVISVATDFDTLDKYKTVFGSTRFGAGAIKTESNSTFSDVDLATVPGAIFVDAAAFTDGDSLQLAIPVPFGADLDIVATALEGKSGAVTLQTEVKSFNGPTTDDGGVAYSQFVDAAYKGFLNGDQQIDRQRDFTVASDFTTNPDFTFLTDRFSDLTDAS
jgi:hypothetical protein